MKRVARCCDLPSECKRLSFHAQCRCRAAGVTGAIVEAEMTTTGNRRETVTGTGWNEERKAKQLHRHAGGLAMV
jgi:hypothetical protein